ncbi:MAG: hypothetical protein Q9227_008567 [Pyrenula ochraceoflavens]
MSGPSKSSATLIIGLSGPSSSGKTTLARHLRSIFNVPASDKTNGRSISLTIIHQDDFYKPDSEIPTVKTPSHPTPIQDWDCAASLNIPLFTSTLHHIHTHGALPPHLHSKEDLNAVGPSTVPPSSITSHHSAIASWLSSPTTPTPNPFPFPSSDDVSHLSLFILDGFLLYPSPLVPDHPLKGIPGILDIKLFLRSTFALTKSRREKRKGYVTIEGFWEDPEGYVEEVVWPNFVGECGWMFEGGDVERGEVRRGVGGGVGGEGYGGGGGREGGGGGILVGPGKGEVGMQELVDWGVEVVRGEVERCLGRRDVDKG